MAAERQTLFGRTTMVAGEFGALTAFADGSYVNIGAVGAMCAISYEGIVEEGVGSENVGENSYEGIYSGAGR